MKSRLMAPIAAMVPLLAAVLISTLSLEACKSGPRCFEGVMERCQCDSTTPGFRACASDGYFADCQCGKDNRNVKRGTREFLSPVYSVDKEYRSMMGPQSTKPITLTDADPPEIVWVTGYRATMVDESGKQDVSQEFMCHSNLDLNMKEHRELFGWQKYGSDRLFTLSQGQQHIEFPAGFGMPMLSNEVMRLNTQVLNLNWNGKPRTVRHKVNVDYVHGSSMSAPYKPLFMVAANALVLLEGKDGYFGIDKADPEKHGEGCLPGQPAHEGSRVWADPQGRKFSGHWVVPPGKQLNHTNVTKYLNIPFDTTAHYAAVHVHPFAVSLELRDITAKKSLFKSMTKQSQGRAGLDHVDFYSSSEGFEVFRDHEYELITEYNNTSGKDQDSMAVMLLYLLDKEFTLADG